MHEEYEERERRWNRIASLLDRHDLLSTSNISTGAEKNSRRSENERQANSFRFAQPVATEPDRIECFQRFDDEQVRRFSSTIFGDERLLRPSIVSTRHDQSARNAVRSVEFAVGFAQTTRRQFVGFGDEQRPVQRVSVDERLGRRSRYAGRSRAAGPRRTAGRRSESDRRPPFDVLGKGSSTGVEQ